MKKQTFRETKRQRQGSNELFKFCEFSSRFDCNWGLKFAISCFCINKNENTFLSTFLYKSHTVTSRVKGPASHI